MPTHPVYRYKIVTTAGEFSTSTKEPMEDEGIDNWIKANQDSINSRFGVSAGSPPVKVTAVHRDKGGTQVKIWGE